MLNVYELSVDFQFQLYGSVELLLLLLLSGFLCITLFSSYCCLGWEPSGVFGTAFYSTGYFCHAAIKC